MIVFKNSEVQAWYDRLLMEEEDLISDLKDIQQRIEELEDTYEKL